MYLAKAVESRRNWSGRGTSRATSPPPLRLKPLPRVPWVSSPPAKFFNPNPRGPGPHFGTSESEKSGVFTVNLHIKSSQTAFRQARVNCDIPNFTITKQAVFSPNL